MALGTVKPAAWRRWLGIALRTLHLMAVVALGASLAGAPALAWGGPATLASGLALLLAERLDGRLFLNEAAGWVVWVKLAAVAIVLLVPASGMTGFWALMAVSAVSAHAPRAWRHWRPGSSLASRRMR